MPELVTIARYRDLPEAWIAKGKLESAGVPCFIADDNIIRLNWFLGDVIGGIKLQVSSEFAETANKLLAEEIADDDAS